MIYETLVINAGLIFSLVVAVCLVSKRWRQGAVQSQAALGLVFGLIAIVSMLFPFELDEGLIFDARTVVVSVAGMFGGPLAAGVSALFAVVCRLFLGGIGTWTGICVIVTTAGLGSAYFQLRRRKIRNIATIELYGFGLLVHIVVLTWMLALPGEVKWNVLRQITLPFLLILPVGIVFLSRLLLRQEEFIRNEIELRQTQEKYRSIFETAAELMLWVDRNGVVVDCNNQIDAYLGYNQNEVIGRNAVQLIELPDQYRTIDELTNAIFRENTVKFVDVNMIRMDGTRILTNINASSLHVDPEDTGEAIFIVEDIMERKNAEKHRDQLFAYSLDMLCIAGINGSFKQVNPAWEKSLGWEVSDLLGRRLIDFVHPDDRDRTQTAESRLKEGKTITAFRNRYRCKDGSYRWLSWTSYPHLEDGLIFSMARDISDMVDAQKALQESQEQLSAVFNAADKIAFIVTDANSTTPDILEFSPGAESIFGCSRTGKIGRPLSAFLTERDAASMSEINHQLSTLKACVRKEAVLIRHSGEEFPALLSIFPLLDKSGDMYGVLWVVIDISDVKFLEKQVSQTQRLESIGTLAGGIAHDFNNILSSIIGFTELSIDDVQKDSSLADNLNEVLTAGKRAKDLVSQILTFSREEQKEKVPIKPDLIVREAIKLLKASLPSTITIKNDWCGKHLIMGDTSQLHQIVMNLATNAAHAMKKEGGTLEVRLEDVVLDEVFCSMHRELSPGEYVLLTVADSGHGIPKENLSRIFDPFFTTKKKNEGTGLGLSVVHGIIKGSGGAIYVDSEPSQGTVFRLYFPAVKMHVADELEVEVALPVGSEHILFVDDEPSVVKMGSRILSSLGYTVTTRMSSLEALELFKNNSDKFDLVISDMTMPQMTGDLLTAEIKRIKPSMPIILCTGFNLDHDGAGIKHIGIEALINKPVLKQELATKVRAVLDRSGSTPGVTFAKTG